MKPLLVLIWLLVGVFYWWLHNDSQQACCLDQSVVSTQLEDGGDNNEVENNTRSIEKEDLLPAVPILFNFSGAEPITGTSFIKMKDSLLNIMAADEVVEINGQYSRDEAYDGGFSNLGIARAENIKTLLSKYLDSTRIVTTSSELKNGINDKTTPGIYSTLARRVRTAKIKEINDRTLIYFPYNSTSQLEDAELEAYMDAVIKRLNQTNEKIYLMGHTDSFGDASYNYQLGLSRAKIIQKYLISKGIPSSRIKVDSKGETRPIASNNTEEGRSKNRRTELVITE